MILFFILAALSASTFTLGKEALLYTTPLFLIAFRLSGAGLLFLITHRLLYRGWPSKDSIDWISLAQIAFFPYFIGFVSEFSALHHMASWKVAFMYGLSPVIAAALSYVSCNERLTVRKLIGLCICLLGFIPELLIKAPEEGVSLFCISWPELLLFIAILAFVYGWILMRKVYKKPNTSTLFVNGIGMLGGGLLSFTVSLVQQWHEGVSIGSEVFFPVSNLARFFLFAVALLIVGNILCTALYTELLKRYTASLVTFNELITPLFAAAYGWFFLHEHVSWVFFVSLVTIFGGMYLFYTEEKRQGNFC